MIMHFCPNSAAPSVQVPIEDVTYFEDGACLVKITLTIPSEALKTHDILEVFGEALSPSWGNPGAGCRFMTLIMPVNYNSPEEIEANVNTIFWEVVTEAQAALSSYFEKQV